MIIPRRPPGARSQTGIVVEVGVCCTDGAFRLSSRNDTDFSRSKLNFSGLLRPKNPARAPVREFLPRVEQ